MRQCSYLRWGSLLKNPFNKCLEIFMVESKFRPLTNAANYYQQV